MGNHVGLGTKSPSLNPDSTMYKLHDAGQASSVSSNTEITRVTILLITTVAILLGFYET